MIRFVVLACFAAFPAAAADLNVSIYGGIPSTGQVLAALFASEEDWMKTPAAEKTVPIDQHGGAQLAFPNLLPGSYAISVIYDQDSDGELNVNLFGIPTEGFGFSNGARASFGPPKWRKTRFAISEGTTAITIRLDRTD